MTDRKILRTCPISGFADEIDANVDKQLALLKELGINWIELRSADGINVSDLTIEQAKNLQKKLAENGIRVSALGSPIGKIGIGDDFSSHFVKFKHVAQLADIFETPNIRMFSFFMPNGSNPADYRDEVLSRLSRMVDYAAGHKLVLLHENEKDIYGDIAPRCLDLMKEFYGEAFKATFDFANFVQCGQDTWEAYEMLKPYIHYIHVKDAMAGCGQVVPAGCGDGQLFKIFTELEAAGYRGFLSLEPHLSDFAGLKGLEKDAQKRGRTDGEAAFAEAYSALRKVLAR